MIKFREKRNAFSCIFGTLSGTDSSDDDGDDQDEDEDDSDKVCSTLSSEGAAEGCTEHTFLHSADKVLLYQNKTKGIAYQLWPAAVQMCHYLENNIAYVLKCIDDVHNRREIDLLSSNDSTYNYDSSTYKPPHINVIELGAGIGLVGIFTSILFSRYSISSHVIVTDLPETMETISRNIQVNSESIDVKSKAVALPLPWGDISAAESVTKEFESLAIDSSSQPPLLVVLADCVYWEHLFTILYNTLHYLASHRDAVIIMAHTKRWKKDNKFFKMCKKSLNVVMLKEEIVQVYSEDDEGGEGHRTIKRVYLMYKKS